MEYSSRQPFYLHAAFELPAALNFFLYPFQQLSLPCPAPQAEAVVRQYAVLLFTTVLVALIFALRPITTTSRRVAGALALYHFAPLLRAVARIRAGPVALDSGLGGPWTHAAIHTYALLHLALLFFSHDADATPEVTAGKE